MSKRSAEEVLKENETKEGETFERAAPEVIAARKIVHPAEKEQPAAAEKKEDQKAEEEEKKKEEEPKKEGGGEDKKKEEEKKVEEKPVETAAFKPFFSFGVSSNKSPFANIPPLGAAPSPISGTVPAAGAPVTFTPFSFAGVSSAPLFPIAPFGSAAPATTGEEEGTEDPEAEVPAVAATAEVVEVLPKEKIQTGEEDEDIVMEITPMKLYRMESGKGWVERGKGTMHLNVNKEDKSRARLIIRAEATMRVLLNVLIWSGMTCMVDSNSGKAVTFTVPEEEEEKKVVEEDKKKKEKAPKKGDSVLEAAEPAKKVVVVSTYSIRVRTNEQATQLMAKIKELTNTLKVTKEDDKTKEKSN